MKTAKELHATASAEMDKLKSAVDKLFAEADAEGHSAPVSNDIWAQKYQSRYNALDRALDLAYRVFWYTDSEVSHHNKKINHRATVAPMRAAGLHKMSL